MKKTTIWLTEKQIAALAQAANQDGLKSAHIIRIYINEGLKRRARSA